MDSLSGIAGGRYGSLSVDAVLRRSALEGADRGLYAALVFGVLERQTTLDFLAEQLSARPPEQLPATLAEFTARAAGVAAGAVPADIYGSRAGLRRHRRDGLAGTAPRRGLRQCGTARVPAPGGTAGR